MSVALITPAPIADTDSVFIKACRRQEVPHTPVWVMRQAGRYLPEYRELRSRVDFVTLTRSPELAAEVTLQPVRRFPLDAAILFSDIMTPLQGMGIPLTFEPGPVVATPIRSLGQVQALPALNPERDVPFVLDAVKLVRANAPRGVPLIGIARSFLYNQPEAALLLIDHLADAMAAYLSAQARAGAQALMLFESWAGLLAPPQFRQFALRGAKRTLGALRSLGVPLIYYANQGSALMEEVRTLDVDVIGVDWRSPLGAVRRTIGPDKALQGNLDPAALFASPEELKRQIDIVLTEAGTRPGHIFNLGHGIWPDTDPDAVARLIDHVQARTSRGARGTA